MKAKDFLNQYYNAKRKTSLLDRELNLLKETEGDIRATDYGKVIVDGTRNPDTIGDFLAQLEDKRDELLKAKLEAHKMQHRVLSVITRLEDPLLNELLFARFIDLKEWEDIANEMAYSLRNIHYMKDRAYAEVEQILKEDKWKTN